MIKRIATAALLAALAIALVPQAALAQNDTPGGASRVRVFGGFSYLRFSAPGNGEIPDLDENTYGLQGNLVYYFHERVGFMVDGAFNTGNLLPDDPANVPDGVTGADLTQTTLLFGPSFVLTDSDRFTAQAYGAIGWAIASIDVVGVSENEVPIFDRLDRTVFAASFGANVDIMLGDGGWGIRPAQVEVLVSAFDETLTNFRYSAGIVGTF